MIPKIIHYCWFGGKPLPESAIKCIESWKKFFPDYEIKEWNESNFDFNVCNYTREAYEAKKWAFVSDYARFFILYRHGGLYFDTDVEVIRSFSDIVGRGAFMGCEKKLIKVDDDKLKNKSESVANPGLGLGVAPGSPLYKEILDYYNTQHFLNANGIFEGETVVDKTTRVLMKHGFNQNLNKLQKIAEVWIYPAEYFCPMDYQTGKLDITDNTYSIHHYTASWQTSTDRFKTKIKKIIGERASSYIMEIKKKLKKNT